MSSKAIGLYRGMKGRKAAWDIVGGGWKLVQDEAEEVGVLLVQQEAIAEF